MRAWSLTLVAAFGLVACSGDKPAPAPAPVAVTPAPPIVADAAAPAGPVTADEAAAFAQAFQRAASPCVPSELTPLIDADMLRDRTLARTGLPADQRAAAATRIEASLGAIGARLCRSFGPEARLTLLRIQQRDGRPLPLFRLSGGEGVNYYELELGRSPRDHAVRLVDFYTFHRGEAFSATLADLSNHVGDQDQANLAALAKATQEGDVAEAQRRLAALPPALRDSKPIQLMQLRIFAADDPAYTAVIARLERDFPGDPALDLVSIDGFLMRKDTAGTLRAVERLDRRVGGDPYLGTVRASAYLLQPTRAHLDQALRESRAVVDALPDEEDAWWTLLATLLARQDHAAVLTTLDTMVPRFGLELDPDTLAGEPMWKSFLASREYKMWVAP